jgi:hypothetical protein
MVAANLNVITRSPSPTNDDYVGFPLMHSTDLPSCVPISACYPGAAIPKLDDAAALGRLYPATRQPPTPTAGIHGTGSFTDASGNAVQPMQGVNVVARLLVNGTPARRYVVTSVSGFAFRGNAVTRSTATSMTTASATTAGAPTTPPRKATSISAVSSFPRVRPSPSISSA